MEFEKWFEDFCDNRDLSLTTLKEVAEIAYREGFFEHQRKTPLIAKATETGETVILPPEDERPLPEGEKWATDEELESFDFKAELEKQKKETK